MIVDRRKKEKYRNGAFICLLFIQNNAFNVNHETKHKTAREFVLKRRAFSGASECKQHVK